MSNLCGGSLDLSCPEQVMGEEREETVLFSLDPVIEGSENHYRHEDITLHSTAVKEIQQQERSARESLTSLSSLHSTSLSESLVNDSSSSEPMIVDKDSNVDGLEDRILLFDRTGNGFVHFLLLREGILCRDGVDTFTEQWRELIGLRDFGVCQYGDWIYIIGGYDLKIRTHIPHTKRYSLVEETWEQLPDMFVARSAFAVAIALNKVYVTGGERVNGKPTCSCEAFDLNSLSWERVGLLPEACQHHACATDGRRVYVSGGINKHKKRHRNVWLSENFTWNETDAEYPTFMSSAVSHHCMHMRNGTLYFFAGIEQVKKKPAQQKKQQAPHPNEQRDTPRAGNSNKTSTEWAVVEYIEEDGSVQTALCQKCSSHQITLQGRDFDDGTNKTKNKRPKMPKRKEQSLETNKNTDYYRYKNVDGYVLSSNNQDNKPKTQDLKRTSSESFMPFVTSTVSDDSWFISPWDRELPPLQHPRHSAASIILGNKMYIMGGAGPNGRTVNMIEYFDFEAKTWASAFKLPSSVHAVNVSCVRVRCPAVRNKPLHTEPDPSPDVPEYRWVLW